MKLARRKFLHLAAGAVALPAVSRVATAQIYPTRPITIIVPVAPGAAFDSAARLMTERMRAFLGQPVIVENVGGANGNIGAGRAARAMPDGHTIVLGDQGTHVINSALYSLTYDVSNDFAPICPLVKFSQVLVAKKTMPGKNLTEMIAWLKANPDKASAGVSGSQVQLITALFQKETTARIAFVPYRGGAPAVQDLVAGQIDLLFIVPFQLPLVRAGSIKAYAVTSDTRLVSAPNIPTFSEMGFPGLSYSSWLGFFAPKNTPKDIIGKLNAAAVVALADPAVQSRLSDFGLESFPAKQQTPEALGALVKADAEKWWPLIKELGIKAE